MVAHTTIGDVMSAQRNLWSSTASIKSRETLLKDIECDVLVIGGGIAGVLTAHFLTQNNIDTVLVEARSLCSGQTANTTAKITSQHGACYSDIEKKFSSDTAILYANANEHAIDEFERLICNLHTDCDFERLPSYLYSMKSMNCVKSEFSVAQKSDISASLTTKTELPFSVNIALRYDNQAQFNPYPFISKLSESITVFENTKVNKVEGNIAYCENARIKAKRIVFATHYPIVNFPGMYFARMYQSRSYVAVMKNTPQINSMYYNVDKGGLSFRGFREYMLVSGCSHRTGENGVCSQPYEYLYKQALKFYPEAQFCYNFSAQDCMSPDNLPYAGVYAKSRANWFVLTGFSKWGMTNSMLSAKLVSDLIIGNANPLEEVLSPSRFNLSTVKPVFNEALHSIKGLSKTAFRIPVDSLADIKRGEAKVVMYGGKRCRVYRSEEGEVYAVSARCPHLGCALSWNATEKSWDCPCHGSRFSYKGDLIDSPAQVSLKRYN